MSSKLRVEIVHQLGRNRKRRTGGTSGAPRAEGRRDAAPVDLVRRRSSQFASSAEGIIEPLRYARARLALAVFQKVDVRPNAMDLSVFA